MPCDTPTSLYAVSAFFQLATVALSATGTALPQLIYFSYNTNSVGDIKYSLGAWQLCANQMFGCQGIDPMNDFATSDGDLIQVYRAFGIIGTTLSLMTAIGIFIRTILWFKRSKSAPVFDGLMLGGSAVSVVSLIVTVSVASALFAQFGGLTWWSNYYNGGNNYSWLYNVGLGASFFVQVVSAATAIIAWILHAIAVRKVKKINKQIIGGIEQPGAGINDNLLQHQQSILAYSPSPFHHPKPATAAFHHSQPVVNVYAQPQPQHHYHSDAHHIQYAAHQPVAGAAVVRYPVHMAGGYVSQQN